MTLSQEAGSPARRLYLPDQEVLARDVGGSYLTRGSVTETIAGHLLSELVLEKRELGRDSWDTVSAGPVLRDPE